MHGRIEEASCVVASGQEIHLIQLCVRGIYTWPAGKDIPSRLPRSWRSTIRPAVVFNVDQKNLPSTGAASTVVTPSPSPSPPSPLPWYEDGGAGGGRSKASKRCPLAFAMIQW